MIWRFFKYIISFSCGLNKILYLRDSGLNVSEIALALTMDEQSLLAQLDKKRIFSFSLPERIAQYQHLSLEILYRDKWRVYCPLLED